MIVASTIFKNRTEAGQELAGRLKRFRSEDTIVYALPRGGVVVGYEIAKALKAPLDIITARKIGHPDFPEYAIAAVTQDGWVVKNEEVVESIPEGIFDQLLEKERAESKRRHDLYLSGIKIPSANGKVAILVDDGLATGLTARAAISELRSRRPKKIILAVPLAPDVSFSTMEAEVDEFICLRPEANLTAIGLHYREFTQVSDKEVIQLIRRANLDKFNNFFSKVSH